MQTQTVSFQVPTQYVHEFKDILQVISKSMKFEIKELDGSKKKSYNEAKKEYLTNFRGAFIGGENAEKEYKKYRDKKYGK